MIWGLGPGGAERVLTTLANAWSETADVTLITLTDGLADHYELSDTVRRRTLYAVGSENGGTDATATSGRQPRVMERAGDVVRNLRIVSRLRAEIARVRPDVVVSFIDRTNILTLIATRGLDVPVVVSERTDPRHHGVSRSEERLRKVTYPWADGVVVQTRSVRTWAEQFVPRDRIFVIPNPVEIPEAVPDLDQREAVVAAVGRLIESKRYDHLISAFARAAERHPGWRLEIAGQGPAQPELEALASRLRLTDRVTFLGLLPDVSTLLRRAKVFALSSRYEGFPNALLEAMAWGVAPLSTDCPSGPGEIIDHGHNGLLVPTFDLDAFEEALELLLSSRVVRSSVAEGARLSAMKFAVPSVLEMWETVFRDVCQHRAG